MSGVIVDTKWVAEHLGTPDLRIVEVDHERETYDPGHIPGALVVDWRRDLMASGDESSGIVIPPEAFAALMGRLGIAPSDAVLCYGDEGGRHAIRLLWTLEYYGHRRFHFLDGGRERWLAEGRPVTTDEPSPAPTRYPVPTARAERIRATAADVRHACERHDATILDVRTRGEYDGSDARAARGGRVPGARWVEWSQALDEAGALKPFDELRKLYAGAGVKPGRPVITYCQLGVRAAHTWFVLRHVLGYGEVRNYDGSWSEWGNREDLPVET